jgi:hypothetical protein
VPNTSLRECDRNIFGVRVNLFLGEIKENVEKHKKTSPVKENEGKKSGNFFFFPERAKTFLGAGGGAGVAGGWPEEAEGGGGKTVGVEGAGGEGEKDMQGT